MNEKTQIDLRRYQSNLALSGMAYIAFGIWSVIRLIIQFALTDLKMNPESLEMLSGSTALFAAFAVIVVFIVINLTGIQIIIGFKAIKYARNLGGSVILPIVTAFLVLLHIFDIVYIFMAIFDTKQDGTDTSIAAILIEITTLIIVFDMMWSSIRIKMLNPAKEKHK